MSQVSLLIKLVLLATLFLHHQPHHTCHHLRLQAVIQDELQLTFIQVHCLQLMLNYRLLVAQYLITVVDPALTF
jgi:hypothetical protein